MTHLWVRAESRANETRVGITPAGVRDLIAAGFTVTVEDSPTRVIPTADYAATGCAIAPEGAWPDAPVDAIVFGLKELPEDGTPLRHRHIMFGHAFKGQPAGQVLLRRLRAGGGRLLDLEYLTDDGGRRLAAFGYWAGYAGAAVGVHCLAAQRRGEVAGPVRSHPDAAALRAAVGSAIGAGRPRGDMPTALVIGAKGRVGTGAADLLGALGVATTLWDMAETASGGPFPEVLDHTLFLNCILARPGTPVFVPVSALTASRRLRVIADIACDPDSDFSPIKVYDRTTTWEAPALRVHDAPPLDVTAIDNLPSLLPRESSEDFAAQLLPVLVQLADAGAGPWARAWATYDAALAGLD